MQLTAEQETDIQKIMAEMDCPHSFRCYKSKFEKLVPVKLLSATTIECLKAEESFCQMSASFGLSAMICQCPLRRYVVLELGR